MVGWGRLLLLGTSKCQTSSPLGLMSMTACLLLSATMVLPFSRRWAASELMTVGLESFQTIFLSGATSCTSPLGEPVATIRRLPLASSCTSWPLLLGQDQRRVPSSLILISVRF